MIFLPARTLFRFQMIALFVSVTIGSSPTWVYAGGDIQFNTDILDVDDRKNIDLSQFSRSGYIMPGDYSMVVHINKNEIPEQKISFYAPDNEPTGSRVCISKALVEQLGLKAGERSLLAWWHKGECLDESSLPGITSRVDLATDTLYLSVPQAYLEYNSENWDPPSRWDEGIPGLLLDYNVNALSQHQQKKGSNGYSVSGNGTTGVNVSSWRLRGDWQAQINHQTGTGQLTDNQLNWSRYYAYHAIPALRSRLTLGEDYLNSRIFDGFRFAGASLISDDSMLPPNLRGYAPEVAGVAKTNAKVVISQQGRVIYETQVAVGPFRIRDINDAVSGELDVRVEEQDGTVQAFKINTASIPYLTRPGSLRFNLAVGKPSDLGHRSRGPLFGTGEFSWGVSNGWSLYGGALLGGDYNALSLGMGRDLMMFGALSFDITQSRARMLQQDETLSGGSYRLSYSKTFDELDSQVTFAGYRFSQEDFMSMNEYLDVRYFGKKGGNSKEMYLITLSKQFSDWGASAYLNYNHQTYWDRPDNDSYNLTISRYFDVSRFKNLNLSLSAYSNRYNETRDDGIYLSLSVPWGNAATLSYSTTLDRNGNNQLVGYYERIDEHSNYQLNVGNTRSNANLSGYYSHDGDMARLTANASYQANRYSAVGGSAQGGMTLTSQGGALHRIGTMGATRLLLDTNGIAGVPVRGYGSTVNTNYFGKAVVADINSYYRNQVSIDLNKLGDNAEAIRSVVQATLTEGAIGYRKFDVIAGKKVMAIIKLANGNAPPFGATVQNRSQQEVGIVNDGGNVYLSGINTSENMTVHWDGATQCQIHLPPTLSDDILMKPLLLPCRQTISDAIGAE
jgi:outer membrane usher protein PapC